MTCYSFLLMVYVLLKLNSVKAVHLIELVPLNYLTRACCSEHSMWWFSCHHLSCWYRCILWFVVRTSNWPDSQIPLCIAPYPTMHHFVTEMCTCVNISVTKWCIVGYLSNALWDFLDGFIVVCNLLSEYPRFFSHGLGRKSLVMMREMKI